MDTLQHLNNSGCRESTIGVIWRIVVAKLLMKQGREPIKRFSPLSTS